MFTIGAFARLAGVSVRTLRYYEEVEVLVPAEVDPGTGYRRYRAGQLPRLHRIAALKDLGLSLEQLRLLLDDVDASQLRALLVEKRAELHNRLATEQERLERVEQRLRYIESEDDMSVDLVIKHVPALRVAQVRWTGPGMPFQEVGDFARENGVLLLERLGSAGVTIDGSGFMYYDDLDDGTVVPAVAVPIGAQDYDGDDVITIATLPETEVVSTSYQGPGGHDEAIGPLYGQMARFAEDHGYDVHGPGRDHLIEFLADGVHMELQLPVAKIG
jgi:DNA-binding transcriptional MerR regulator